MNQPLAVLQIKMFSERNLLEHGKCHQCYETQSDNVQLELQSQSAPLRKIFAGSFVMWMFGWFAFPKCEGNAFGKFARTGPCTRTLQRKIGFDPNSLGDLGCQASPRVMGSARASKSS